MLIMRNPNDTYHTHLGQIHFSDILASNYGDIIPPNKKQFVLCEPTLEEYVVLMKRGATISYPKDCSAIMGWLDLKNGSKVLEAGTGSGAMTLFLSKAVGNNGEVRTYEKRFEHLNIAKKKYYQLGQYN